MSASYHQSERLPCPSCGSTDARVKESLNVNGGSRRRYHCAACATRFHVFVASEFWYEDDGKRMVKTETMTYSASRKKTVLRQKPEPKPRPQPKQATACEVRTHWVGDIVAKPLSLMEMLR